MIESENYIAIQIELITRRSINQSINRINFFINLKSAEFKSRL